MSKKEVGHRLRLIRSETGLSQKDFALRLGYETYAPIKDIENGVTTLKPVIARAIDAEFNVNKEWLLHGEGQKDRHPKLTPEDFRARVIEAIKIVEEVLINNKKHLSVEKKAELVMMVFDATLRDSLADGELQQLILNLVKLAE